MDAWMTIAIYKQVVFHVHDSFRECKCISMSQEGGAAVIPTSKLEQGGEHPP